MGACSSNESIIAIRWKFSCLKIRFEKIISDRLSVDKLSQRGILITPSMTGPAYLEVQVLFCSQNGCFSKDQWSVWCSTTALEPCKSRDTHISISGAVAHSRKWKHFNSCSGLDLTTINVSCLSSGSVEMEQVLLMINVLGKSMSCWRVVRLLHTA